MPLLLQVLNIHRRERDSASQVFGGVTSLPGAGFLVPGFFIVRSRPWSQGDHRMKKAASVSNRMLLF
jgi:hypothetical protein